MKDKRRADRHLLVGVCGVALLSISFPNGVTYKEGQGVFPSFFL